MWWAVECWGSSRSRDRRELQRQSHGRDSSIGIGGGGSATVQECTLGAGWLASGVTSSLLPRQLAACAGSEPDGEQEGECELSGRLPPRHIGLRGLGRPP